MKSGHFYKKRGHIMAREIEMKIPLNQEKYDYIYDVIFGKKSIDGLSVEDPVNIVKKDEYYSKYEIFAERVAKVREGVEPQVIRIRTVLKSKDGAENKKYYFTIKRKSVENGIELNKEDETFIEKPYVLRDLFKLAGYTMWFEKQKNAFSTYCKCSLLDGADFHLELEVVNGFRYIEVEVTDEKYPADEVKAALGEFMKIFGLNPDDKDGRSWKEIVSAD